MSIVKTGLGVIAASALVFTAVAPASAANAVRSQQQVQAADTGAMTDISARRRGGGGGGAAAAAAFAGIVGTAIAVGASRNYYDDGYYGRTAYGYGSPYDSYNSYDGGGYYGGGYSRPRGGVYGAPDGYRTPENNPSR